MNRLDKYRLHIGEGVAMRPEDDAMATHNNQQFSTYDEDNDVKSDGNCASLLVAGWWYNNCFSALLTGPHLTPDWFAVLYWRIYHGNFAYSHVLSQCCNDGSPQVMSHWVASYKHS